MHSSSTSPNPDCWKVCHQEATRHVSCLFYLSNQRTHAPVSVEELNYLCWLVWVGEPVWRQSNFKRKGMCRNREKGWRKNCLFWEIVFELQSTVTVLHSYYCSSWLKLNWEMKNSTYMTRFPLGCFLTNPVTGKNLFYWTYFKLDSHKGLYKLNLLFFLIKNNNCWTPMKYWFSGECVCNMVLYIISVRLFFLTNYHLRERTLAANPSETTSSVDKVY